MDDYINDPIHLPIEDELDLHTFKPKEVPDLLDDYIGACIDIGILEVRIIPGKGTGALKKRVVGILEKDVRVELVKEAPPEAGGWGALIVKLKQGS
ncbi:MAG: Smr/MutS family protein [Desulfobacterales bacterium]|nr:Smr/MutS family protein [Desulfobacterales bacterium]